MTDPEIVYLIRTLSILTVPLYLFCLENNQLSFPREIYLTFFFLPLSQSDFACKIEVDLKGMPEKYGRVMDMYLRYL